MENTNKVPSEEKRRTTKQNNALHLFCELLADKLNEAGISQRALLEAFEIDHSSESIKNIFRQIGKQKYSKDSTSKLTTKECIDIYDEINRQSSILGIHQPWPTEEEVYYRQKGIK